jgi:hypothetical protein
MMKDKVVSLEVAKELPEGFKSEFYWYRYYTIDLPGTGEKSYSKWFLGDKKSIITKAIESIPAPLLCEMLELLPNMIQPDRKNYYRLMSDWMLKGIFYMSPDYKALDGSTHFWGGSKNPATAAAELYIWLKDNDYIKESEGDDRYF